MVTRTRYRSPGSVITTIAGVVAAIILLGIVLVLMKANPTNEIVKFVEDLARFLTTPFHNLFPQDNPQRDVLVNWGIAAIVYLIVGALIARLLRR